MDIATPSTSSMITLQDNNYESWSLSMQRYLEANGLWDVVELNQMPKQGNIKEWLAKNASALKEIKEFCGEKALDLIKSTYSAAEAWEKLGVSLQKRKEVFPSISAEVQKGREILGGMQRDALLNAIYKGQIWEVKNIVDPNLEATSARLLENGYTAFHVAITAGQLLIAEELIKKSRKNDLKIQDSRGNTALHVAITYGQLRIVDALISTMEINDLKIQDNSGNTALHVVISAGQLGIAEALITKMDPNDLEIQDNRGDTPLGIVARKGMINVAKCLIRKNKKLLIIPNTKDKIPVQLACSIGNEDMTRYLYRETPLEFLNGSYGITLLEECLPKKMFDIALDLLRHISELVFHNSSLSRSILSILSQTPPPFFGGNQLGFWRHWIYNCIRVKVDFIKPGGIAEDDEDDEDEEEYFSQRFENLMEAILRGMLLKFLAKEIHDLKSMDLYADKVLHLICQRLSTLDHDQFQRSGAVTATFQAIENGIPEIAIELIKANENLLWSSINPEDPAGNMFIFALQHRQEEVVGHFLYGFDHESRDKNIVTTIDEDKNNTLHLVALAPNSELSRISGAALQLQNEIRWFKAVQGIVPWFYNYEKNKEGETPFQLFDKRHKTLLLEAEKWVKKTAESSTVVGSLILTIMFAVAFTVPGGNDQSIGFPIFLRKSTKSSLVVPFMVFIVSDAISLFAASSSVLMFLGILTSRYAYEDFLKSLPTKLIIGLSSLFISIATMTTAFCAALFIILQDRLWVVLPIMLLACIPVSFFVLLQFPLLVEIYTSTFRHQIFARKRISKMTPCLKRTWSFCTGERIIQFIGSVFLLICIIMIANFLASIL